MSAPPTARFVPVRRRGFRKEVMECCGTSSCCFAFCCHSFAEYEVISVVKREDAAPFLVCIAVSFVLSIMGGASTDSAFALLVGLFSTLFNIITNMYFSLRRRGASQKRVGLESTTTTDAVALFIFPWVDYFFIAQELHEVRSEAKSNARAAEATEYIARPTARMEAAEEEEYDEEDEEVLRAKLALSEAKRKLSQLPRQRAASSGPSRG